MTLNPVNTDYTSYLLNQDIDGIEPLVQLALDTWCSWNKEGDQIWNELHPEVWKSTRNPWIVLQNVSRTRLRDKLSNKIFHEKIEEFMRIRSLYISSPGWFKQNYPNALINGIAYFSMEYMLTEALPIYVGGLGNVAGDQLKAASDLGVPVVGIGLLYAQGYFRQQIDKEGNQVAVFPYNDPSQMPVTPLRLPNGEWLRVKIDLDGNTVWLKAWQVQVGRVKLYLLDSNDASNLPGDREITNELYGGDEQIRIKQEIILGIGGFKLLTALGLKCEVCHMNEGHAAFLVLERASDYIRQTGASFEEALTITRAGNLFTTHTAVKAGFDLFSPQLIARFFTDYAKKHLGIGLDELMSLGRQNESDDSEYFNMAWLATRGSGAVNAVSRLHASVSRGLFQNLYPRWPQDEVPIGYVTNGVHIPTWISKPAEDLWTEFCGKNFFLANFKNIEEVIYKVSDKRIWQFRNQAKENFVDFIRKRIANQPNDTYGNKKSEKLAKGIFDPNVLTLGFARRFVDYKRPGLLLHDKERFIRIMTNTNFPVQMVIAGKAPPFDQSGNKLIREWINFIKQYNLQDRIIFLPDYNMFLTENLVHGVDLWINTPRRPWEASGTSGMKILINGGINLSELDGWWSEAYTPDVGWAIGDGLEHKDDTDLDGKEADTLYNLLEYKVIPEYYKQDETGINKEWIHRIRRSMSKLTFRFSATRSVREYSEQYYLPAAENYNKRASEQGTAGRQITCKLNYLKNNWKEIQLLDLKISSFDGGFLFIALISLHVIHPKEILVEMYAESIKNSSAEKITMEAGSDNGNNVISYHAKVFTERPVNDYTLRVKPNLSGVSMPMETNLILWQK